MIRYLLRFNWPLLLCAVALATLGVVFVGSAGAARQVAALQNAWRFCTRTTSSG